MIETIKKAKARRDIDKPLILHSDRETQYVSKEYKRITETMSVVILKRHIHGITHVLSRSIPSLRKSS